MTDLRTAAQQALEFLDAEFGWSPGEAPRIDNLRAALAQQDEPVSADDAYRKWLEDTHAPALRRMDSQGAFAAGWKAALAQQAEPAQEPEGLAWRYTARIGYVVRPYTAAPPPPQREQLTEEPVATLGYARKIEGLIAQRDALLKELQDLCDTLGECGMTEKARAAIKAVEGENT